MNFLKKYIPIILFICVFFVVAVSAKFISDYRNEQRQIIYKTVDEKKFFQCQIGKEQSLFFLNRSPKNRDANTYSDTTFVMMSDSQKGSGKPSLKSIRTTVGTDFINFWFEPSERYAAYQRPSSKLNRLTGDFYNLREGTKTYCYGGEQCKYNLKEEDYQILKCEEIDEDLFYFHFSFLEGQFESERKF